MGGIPSSSGGGASSSATSGLSFGSDTYSYGALTPAAPPMTATSQTWLIPSIIAAAGIVITLLLTRK